MLPVPGFRLPRRLSALALACALAPVCASTALGQDPDSLFRSTRGLAIAAAPGAQYDVTAIPDGAGGAFVAWADERGGDADIRVQRIGGSGRPVAGWPAGGLVACRAGRDQHGPRLAADGAGGVFVAWEDLRGRLPGVFVQHLLADGRRNPVWPEDGLPVCSADFPQLSPALAADGAGGAIVAWEDRRGGAAAIYVQRFASDATVEIGWPTSGVEVAPAAGAQLLPVLVADDAEGAFVFWEDLRTGAAAAYAQRITWRGRRADGWPSAGLALSPAIGRQDLVRALADGAGGAFVAWRDTRRGTPDLLLMRIRGDGTTAAGWPATGVTLSTYPSEKSGLRLAADGAGGLIAAWEETRGEGATAVWAQHVDPTGRRVPGWPNDGRALSSADGFQVSPAIAGNGAGGAYAVWQDFREGTGHLYGQYLPGGGAPAAGWPAEGLRLASDPSGQLSPAAVPDGAGGAILIWEQGLGEGDLYAARVGPEGLGAQEVQVVSAEAQPGRVTVRWRAQAGASFELIVQRQREGEGWADLGSRVPAADGAILLEDRSVAPGARYGYRLARPTPNGRVYLGEVWVSVAEAPQLALAGMVPNPSRAGASVTFTLPLQSPGTLELIDVAGRRMRWRDLADLGPGRHVVDLGAGHPVPPGFYLVRLVHGNRTLTARATVIR